MRYWGGWGLYGFSATSVVGGIGILATNGSSFSGFSLIAIGILIFCYPVLYNLFIALQRVRVFTVNGDGRAFIVDNIRAACRSGGAVFSTYLLERAEGHDLVAEILQTARNDSRSSETLEYDRLVMIDDPTQEEKWITTFLSLASVLQPNSGLLFKPRVLAVRSPSRPVVRLLQSILLRISITLIDQRKQRGKKLTYISLSDVISLRGSRLEPHFAVAFRDDKIHDMLKNFVFSVIDSNREHIRTLTTAEDYRHTTLQPQMEPLGLRLLSAIEEYALSDINVKHVGVFGNIATIHGRMQRSVANGSLAWRPESDLDLVVVISEGADREAVKNEIRRRLESQADPNLYETVEIEWSNERPTFYFFRHGYHVDVQLHLAGDDYYVSDTRLLGYSIFGSSYYVVYSDQNLPVDRFITIPNSVLGIQERAQLFLSDPLGLYTFIERCQGGDPRINPRRVIAINLVNFVWTVSGMHAPDTDQALVFLERDRTRRDLKLRIEEHTALCSEIRNVLLSDVSEIRNHEWKDIMQTAVDVLIKFKVITARLR